MSDLQTFPSPGDIANPGNKPRSPELQAASLLIEPAGKPSDSCLNKLSLYFLNLSASSPNSFVMKREP